MPPFFCRIIDHLASSSTPSPISATHHATDFFIDASHELALFILNVNKKFKLKSVPYFCNNYGDNCSVYARNENIFCVNCQILLYFGGEKVNSNVMLFALLQNNPVSFDKILFAVKTCEKFHTERLPIVLRTWGKFAFYLRMFSDVQGTVTLLKKKTKWLVFHFCYSRLWFLSVLLFYLLNCFI